MARKSFSDKLKAITAKQKKEIDSNICLFSRQLFHSIIEYTPVGKEWYGKFHNDKPGWLVNNWQPAINSIDLSLQQRAGKNKTGAHKRIDTVVINGSFLRDGYVTLTNNVPYAFRAEYAGWPAPEWSGSTGPYGMVRKSVIDIMSKYGK